LGGWGGGVVVGVVGRFIKGEGGGGLGNRFGMSMWEREREREGGG